MSIRKTLVFALFTLMLAFTDSAMANKAITIHYTDGSGITGTGTLVVPDSLLAPNVNLNEHSPTNNLLSLSLTLSGLPNSPSTTTFTKADVVQWYFTTDGAGNIIDINFWTHLNTDNYALAGVNPFTINIYFGSSGVVGTVTGIVDTPGIPTLSAWGILILATLLIIGSGLALRRHRTLMC
jgi:hypothetical protein